MMNQKPKREGLKKFLSIFLTTALVFTMAIPMSISPVNAESSGSGDDLLKLDEQPPAELANAKNPYGYPEDVAFTLSKGNELMYYGGWNGSTERKMLNGSSIGDLESFVDEPNKGPGDSSKLPSGTWNWVKAVAFDNNADGTKEDKVLFVAVEKNQKAYAWVLDYKQNKLSNTLELGNMDWIGYDYDQYASTSLFQVEAGDFDGDGIDSLLLYAPLNLDDTDDGKLGCILYEMSYSDGTLSTANTVNSLLMDQYITDQNNKKYKDKSDADDTCRDKLAVSMQVGDYNGDNIEDLAVLSYSHRRYSGANTAYYSPQLKICYGNSTFKNFKNKKADEVLTVADTSGSTLTFPVAVSLAAGDYNGDNIDDLYAVGVKTTATTGESVSSISVDGSKWYIHRFHGTLASKMGNSSYTLVNANAWFEDGFYGSDNCYGQVMAAGVAISGNAAPEMLFIAGSLYDVSTGTPVRKAHDNYFDSGDENLGAILATNTFVQSVAVGNFDNNRAGREQAAFIIGMKEKGHDDYWFESGMICGEDFADTTYKDGSTCYGAATAYSCTDVDDASYIHENKGDDTDEGLNCFYIVMDHDDDAQEAKYLGVNYAYTDPAVNAVLQAAPYFGDIPATFGFNATSYTLQTSYSKDETESDSLGGNVGFAGGGSIPFAETTSFAVGVKGGWTKSFTESHQTTYEETFTAGSEDAVVVNRTPMLIYKFDVKDDNGNWTNKVQMEMCVPEGPVYTLLSIDEYNKFVDTYNNMMDGADADYYALKKIDAAANWMDGNEGNPYAYNQNGWADSSIEAAKICKGNGYNLGTAGGMMTVSFTEGESTTDEFTANVGFYMNISVLFGPKSIANYGMEMGGEYSHGWGSAETKGKATGSSFTVQDIDRNALIKAGMDEAAIDLYKFTWTCGGWKRHLGNVDEDGDATKTPFFGYALTNISSPPMKVTDLKVQNASEQEITMSWTKPAAPKGWPSVDGYILYQGISDINGNVSYEPLKKIESADTTSVTIKNLIDGSSVQPDTEYKFVVKSYHKLENASTYADKSNPVTVRTPIKKYTVDLEYDAQAVKVTALQQNGTAIADGDSLPTGTIIKVQADANEDYLISKMIIKDNSNGKTTEIAASEDGSTVVGYYQLLSNTTVTIETKKIIKDACVTFTDKILDENQNAIGTITAKVGNFPIQSGAIISEPITFSAVASDGYVLTEWDVTVDGKQYRYATNDKTEFTLGLVGEEIDVNAKFALKSEVRETVTVIQPAEGGAIELYDASGTPLIPDADGKISVSYDAPITFKAVPQTGYVIDTWTQDAEGQTGESFTMNITGDVTVGIVYKAPVKYTLTYTPEDEHRNCIVPTPYVENGGALAAGTEVKLKAVANNGYRIEKWTITKGSKTEEVVLEGCLTTDEQTVIVDASTTVEVSFTEIEQYSIVLEQIGEGSALVVNKNNFISNGGTVDYADNFIIIAKPEEGWTLSDTDGWTLIDHGIYIKKVENVNEDCTMSIEFIKNNSDLDEDKDEETIIPDPDKPAVPDKPVVPEEPEAPDVSDKPASPDAPETSDPSDAPNTGDTAGNLALPFGVMMAGILAILALRKKYRC